MSDFGEAVREALTPEWQTTVEIAAKVEPSKGVCKCDHRRAVHSHLTREARRGIAER